MISPHESKRSQMGNHYFAFVDLPSETEARAAQRALDNMRIDWGVLRVRMARTMASPKVQREQGCSHLVEV